MSLLSWIERRWEEQPEAFWALAVERKGSLSTPVRSNHRINASSAEARCFFTSFVCYYMPDILQEDKVPQRGASINLTDHLCAVITASEGRAEHKSYFICGSNTNTDLLEELDIHVNSRAFGANNQTSLLRLSSVHVFKFCHYLLVNQPDRLLWIYESRVWGWETDSPLRWKIISWLGIFALFCSANILKSICIYLKSKMTEHMQSCFVKNISK